jgi:16S rRNA (uracil1498-N3)-methyltransferase
MQFIYNKHSKEKTIVVKDDTFRHIFKSRRSKKEKFFYFRNLNDKNLYKYEVFQIKKNEAIFNLVSFEQKSLNISKNLHIAWCITDNKTIERYISSLNELGVKKISFVYCKYSQKHFKINKKRLETILINSSQQCGKDDILKFDIYDSFDKSLEKFPNTFMFNFSINLLEDTKDKIDTIIIGCEGGFSKDEINKIAKDKIIGTKSNLILKSQTAVLGVASKILL